MPGSLTLHAEVMSIKEKEIKNCTYKVYPIHSLKHLVNSTSLQKHNDKLATHKGQSAVSFPANFTEFSKDFTGKQHLITPLAALKKRDI